MSERLKAALNSPKEQMVMEENAHLRTIWLWAKQFVVNGEESVKDKLVQAIKDFDRYQQEQQKLR